MGKPLVVVPGLVRKDAIAYLSEHVEVRQWTEKTPMPRETLKKWLREADGLWSINNVSVDADLVADAPKLKVIAQASVGYDNVKVDDLTAKGIPYGNTPHVLTETVAELAFTLVATARRRILENMEFVTSGQWAQRPSNIKGRDLSRTTLGIIGMGNIGLSISRRNVPGRRGFTSSPAPWIVRWNASDFTGVCWNGLSIRCRSGISLHSSNMPVV